MSDCALTEENINRLTNILKPSHSSSASRMAIEYLLEARLIDADAEGKAYTINTLIKALNARPTPVTMVGPSDK